MALVVGEAEVIITANTAGLEGEIAASSDPAFTKLESDAGDAGALAGANLRGGVTDETGKLKDDLADDGEDAGNALEKGMGGPLSGIKSALSNLGVPESLLNPEAFGAVAIGAAAAGAVDLAMKMQSADAAIATASGTSVKAATAIGNAFLDTAGKTEFSGEEQAKAYATVAGQLKTLNGTALDTKQASTFMNAAMQLATASGTDLGTAVSTVAATLQAYGLKADDSTKVTNALYVASNATGQGIDSIGSALDKMKSKLGGLAPSLQDSSALLVDMTEHGETGRAAMTTLSTAFTTFLKPAADAATAQANLNIAYNDLPDSVKAAAKAYQDGSITSEQFEQATEGMSTTQAALVSNFKSAADAAQTANEAQQKLGITVTNSQGQMLPFSTILGELHDKIEGMSTAQATATLTAMGFGSSAAKLVSTIQAGPAAFDAATASVTNQNTVSDAATTKSQTLAVQFDTLKATVVDFGTQIGEQLLPIIEQLMTVFDSLVPLVGQILSAAFEVLKPILQVLVTNIKDVVNIATDLINFVTDVFEGKWGAAWDSIKSLFGTFVSYILGFPAQLFDLFGTIPGKILSALGDGAKVLLDWGEDLIKGLIDGIENMAADVGNAIGSVISGGLDDAKKALNSIPVIGSALSAIGLATGGYVTKPTFALVGEAGPEYVIPESLLQQQRSAVSPLNLGTATMGGTSGSSGGQTITIQQGAVVINPAPGNDAASLAATEAAITQAMKQLAMELGSGQSPLQAVTG